MKKLKLNLSNMKGNGILTREQLKNIMGGAGASSCASDSDCGGFICCSTTDGSNKKVCVAPTGSGCPTSGVGGCSGTCNVGGVNVGCYYDSGLKSCRCLSSDKACA